MRNDQLPAVPKFGGGWSICTMQPNYETKGYISWYLVIGAKGEGPCRHWFKL